MRHAATVLVVDDDELVRELVVEILTGDGYEVEGAQDGGEALRLLDRSLPDVIVSDVNMPGVDGFELARRLRADQAGRSIPLIFLTTRSAKGDVVTGLGLGADDYLPKPFAPEELLARVRSKVERPSVPSDLLLVDRRSGLLTATGFAVEARREADRADRSGHGGALAVLRIEESEQVRAKVGQRGMAEVERQLGRLLEASLRGADLAGRIGDEYGLLLPDTEPGDVSRRLAAVGAAVVDHVFHAGDERVRLTPVIGWSALDSAVSAEETVARARVATGVAGAQLDLRPVSWSPSLVAHDVVERRGMRSGVRTALQVIVTYLLGIVLPFVAYVIVDRAGFDIAGVMYVAVVAALLVTGCTIWIEGLLALKKAEPPSRAAEPRDVRASAIIAAFLPNEAATVVETVESFLNIEYPPGLKVILAYNTPRPLPVEEVLREIAGRDPRFVPFRVEGSSSKAQNVNAALALADGAFVGIFDADHKPAPTSFYRAHAWLAAGYDVVQGHSVVRNGAASWVARTVAVEFESIYAVSHPGRNRFHDFGIFGGSNGYWRLDLLNRIRMRGTMLTEDIDSSLRVVEGGGRIANDPSLVSWELAPTTLTALWNQRMRWAQGWFQVSIRHLWTAMWHRELTGRQKFGMAFLLGWREIYPWLSLQVFPLIAYWIYRDGTVSRLDWLVPVFVLTTLFTLSVGPGQVYFAYRLGDPSVRRHRRWFWSYLVVAILFYTEWKNLIARVAQIKEMAGDRAWKVTPRGVDPYPGQSV